MSVTGSLLHRLRGRSTAEIRDRLRQALSARAERAGLGAPLGLAPAPLARILVPDASRDPATLLTRFRAATTPHALPGLDDPHATAIAAEAQSAEQTQALLARADRIAQGRFGLMGHRDLSFGTPIDWQLDPIAGRRAPLLHWSRVPYLDPDAVGDHKVVWELNRHQWLVTLGQAYALTGDERWTREMTRQIEHWLDTNAPKLGINWASSLEVAFRSISWLLALRFLKRSPALTPALYARMLESLHVHGRHLETYLSTYFSPNTHLTGEALGLFYIGTLLPELRAARRWQRLGQTILEAQLPVHVRPDGVYFEQATQYDRYTADFYAHLVLLAEANGMALAPHVRPTLERLLEHLLYLSRPDGTIPLFGDDDGGRLVQLDGRTPADVRALLAAGAVLFDRSDFAFAARGDVAGMIWLLGPDGLERSQSLQPLPPDELARAFPHGGYYVSRDGWGTDADWLAFDAGPHGVMNGGHAHADALAFELAVAGRPVFVDSGTYTYPGPERNAFRSAAAHNTVTVDDVSSSVPAAAAFRWERMASARADRWHASRRGTFVAGSHDGYASLPAPARHQRAILHLAGDYWVLRDRIESAGAHETALRFHCAPGLDSCVEPGDTAAGVVDRASGAELLHVAVFGGAGTLTAGDGWVSPQYGRRERSRVLVWRQDGTGDQEIVTFVLPTHGSTHPDVRELTRVLGGRGFALRVQGAEDLVLVGDGGPLSADGVETDAEWLWLRRDGTGRVIEYVAVDASYGRTANGELWRPADRQGWRASADTRLQTVEPRAEATSLSNTGSGAS